MPVPKTTVIPAELCVYVLKSKLVRPFQVFVYLKSKCSGKIKLSSTELDSIARELGLKYGKTINSCLLKLIKINWVGFSPRSGYYFFKGYDQIRILHKFYRRRGVEFSLDEIKNIKGFLIASVIGLLINAQKRRKWAVEPSVGSSKTSAHLHSEYFDIANEALSKILGISISTAFEWKKLAEKQKFINIKKNFEELRIAPKVSNKLKKYGDIPAHLIRYREGKLWIQKPDSVISYVHFRRRSKITEFNNITNSYDPIFGTV